MNLTCYVIDDEFHAIAILKSYIENTPGLELMGYATDPRAALKDITGSAAPDITFVDVDMPELSGMELAGLVSMYTTIVFTTSYPEYAIQAYEKEAFDYLLKPIGYERFAKTVLRARKHLAAAKPAAGQTPDGFYIKSDVKGKLIRVVTEEIYFVEAAQNYVIIHYNSGQQMAYLTMEEIAGTLPADRFVRVHRSFIIHTGRIRSMEQGQVTLQNRATVPIGRLYKESFLASIHPSVVQSKRSAGRTPGDSQL